MNILRRPRLAAVLLAVGALAASGTGAGHAAADFTVWAHDGAMAATDSTTWSSDSSAGADGAFTAQIAADTTEAGVGWTRVVAGVLATKGAVLNSGRYRATAVISGVTGTIREAGDMSVGAWAGLSVHIQGCCGTISGEQMELVSYPATDLAGQAADVALQPERSGSSANRTVQATVEWEMFGPTGVEVTLDAGLGLVNGVWTNFNNQAEAAAHLPGKGSGQVTGKIESITITRIGDIDPPLIIP